MLETWKQEFEGKNICIWGYGIEGKATYRLIRSLFPDMEITIADGGKGLATAKETTEHTICLSDKDCDFSKFNGNSYLKLGFEKERLNKPGFVWLDKNYTHISWRNPYCHEKMKELYPNKIYDCGQLVFVWNRNN